MTSSRCASIKKQHNKRRRSNVRWQIQWRRSRFCRASACAVGCPSLWGISRPLGVSGSVIVSGSVRWFQDAHRTALLLEKIPRDIGRVFNPLGLPWQLRWRTPPDGCSLPFRMTRFAYRPVCLLSHHGCLPSPSRLLACCSERTTVTFLITGTRAVRKVQKPSEAFRHRFTASFVRWVILSHSVCVRNHTDTSVDQLRFIKKRNETQTKLINPKSTKQIQLRVWRR